jgi:hypothetical protein
MYLDGTYSHFGDALYISLCTSTGKFRHSADKAVWCFCHHVLLGSVRKDEVVML